MQPTAEQFTEKAWAAILSAQQLAQSRRALAKDPEEGYAGKHGIWNREGSTFLHFNTLDADGTVYGVNLLEFNDDYSLQWALRARRATFQGDHWVLERVATTSSSMLTPPTLPSHPLAKGLSPSPIKRS